MKAYHLVGKAPYFTNCYIVTDNIGNAVLIDCSEKMADVRKILENDRAKPAALLLTHGHADHVETFEEFKKIYDCPVYLAKEDAELYGIENTIDYTEGETLTFGEMSFKVYKTPGHTPGSVVFLCEDMLFCGDTLFAGTVGRTDLKGGDWDELNKSLSKLKQLIPDNMKVLPGHDHFSTMGQEKVQNPYLKNAK